MNDNDPIVERLRDLGRQPVDPATASQHLSAMAGVRPPIRAWRRYRVGAAFFAGLLVGGTGLASAGALPGGAQNVAHTTLSEVGVSVPDGKVVRSTVGCPSDGVHYKNHGQYVSTHHNDPNAGASQCGKPVQAGQDTPGVSEAPEAPETPEPSEAPEAPDTGKPANPGANGKGHGNGKNKGNSQGQANQGQDEQGTGAETPGPTEAPTLAPKTSPLAPVTTTSTTSTTKAPTTTTSSSTTSTTTH